ncbi:uncharacterized protein MONBRDRAFT_27553 [Monosiga brevicollis MX1]|uniref:Uncharacterized protein n=1 Tax=Monosiga brevicollis TaxID=81824 RepID=A9V5L9_MONBE|nr:uncharacterized protein MONBRDRAFT_27553 [Monosiga brevicollis MX1]EDQ87063.1 predicted protein [Monosiga brevicollis MX1]|eukprot:XP_001748006.1 hypothetical protein [Monosiga brevicollis MX1]
MSSCGHLHFSSNGLTAGLGALLEKPAYVLYDPSLRSSLVVALTAAGLRDAVVAAPAQANALQERGFVLAEDLSQRYRNQTDDVIFRDARDRYLAACNGSLIVWMGGACGANMQPGIADYGVARKAFFVDLNTDPNATLSVGNGTAEYALADEIVATLSQRSDQDFLLQGWHSYCKDEEHTFTTLASRHGGCVHGLNTNPNLSFLSALDVTPGFKFRNNPAPRINATITDKVVVAFVQTDGLGLGAWNGAARGQVPYTWEVTLPDLWIQPALLEIFYREATALDYFVAALGGPGYMYSNAVPPAQRQRLLHKAQQAMLQLDLHEMVTFDASRAEGQHTVTGNTNLSPSAVAAYFEDMNETRFWFNGYAPTFTAARDESGTTARSLLSFEYYLDPSRSVSDVLTDLELLAQLNAQRPYFLAVHVREFASQSTVVELVEKLPRDFLVTAADQFAQLANAHGTFRTRYA